MFRFSLQLAHFSITDWAAASRVLTVRAVKLRGGCLNLEVESHLVGLPRPRWSLPGSAVRAQTPFRCLKAFSALSVPAGLPSLLPCAAAGAVQAVVANGVAGGLVGEAFVAASAEEPARAQALRFARELLLACDAGEGVVRHGSHGRREVLGRLSLAADGAVQLGRAEPARTALALGVGVLLCQLGPVGKPLRFW